MIIPMKQGKECIIKHMLSVDWRSWKSYLRKAAARSITIHMLGNIAGARTSYFPLNSLFSNWIPPEWIGSFFAALRELLRAKAGNTSHEFLSRELTIDIGVPDSEKEEIKTEVGLERIQDKIEDEASAPFSGASSLTGLNDAADEFFDVPEPSDDLLENGWPSNPSPESCYVVLLTFEFKTFNLISALTL